MLREFGKACRSLGRAIDKAGQELEVTGVGAAYVERLVPSTRILSANGQTPVLAESTFVAPNASVIGDVSIAEGASVWYGAVVKGDIGTIKIGRNSAIQDRAEVADACIIGEGVTIAPAANIQKCTIADNCLIGSGAMVLDGASVQQNVIVAPGSVVPAGTKVASGQLWSGNPAKSVRDLTAAEIESISVKSEELLELAAIHENEASKSFEQIEADKEALKDFMERDLDYSACPPNPNLRPERGGLIYNR